MKFFICIALLSLAYQQIEAYKQKPLVAVIGSGVGGTTFSDFMFEKFHHVNITVFEKLNKIGGRTHSINLNGHVHEMGAHFIISDNKYIRELADKMNMTLKDDSGNTFGIYKDKKFQFKSSENKIFTSMKMLYRYGFSLLKFSHYQAAALTRFKWIYPFQEQDKAFYNLEEFIEYTGQEGIFNKTAREVFLDDLGASEQLADEVLDSIISNFYNQNHNVNGYTGQIAAAGLQGNPRKIEQGLQKMVETAYEYMKEHVEVKLNSEVKEVEYLEDIKMYEITVLEKGKQRKYRFDLVVLAAPLEMAKIKFKNMDVKFENRKTKTIYKYAIGASGLKPEFFGEDKQEDIPQAILTPDRIFGKISVFNQLCKDCHINSQTDETQHTYVWTGTGKLTKEELDQLFQPGYDVIFEKSNEWPYPDLQDSCEKQLPPIILNPGFYYLNSMEYLASCMEMEAISARNIINLMISNEEEGKHWIKNQRELYKQYDL